MGAGRGVLAGDGVSATGRGDGDAAAVRVGAKVELTLGAGRVGLGCVTGASNVAVGRVSVGSDAAVGSTRGALAHAEAARTTSVRSGAVRNERIFTRLL